MRLPAFRPNPYRIGGPATGEQFADREREVATFSSLMLNGQNLILLAPRRFGKTSLLLRMVAEVRSQGGRTGRQSLIRCSEPSEVAEAMLKAVLEGPMGGAAGYLREIAQRLARVRVVPQFSIDPQSGLPTASLATAAAGVNWKDVCAEVVRLLNRVAEEGHRVSLILDEFQKVGEIRADLPDIFKDMTDELKGVGLVFAGSKRHLMREMLEERQGALFQVGTVHELGVIPRPEFAAFLVARAEAGGKHLGAPLAERIYDVARGVPHDVQLVAYFAFEAAGRQVDEAAFQEAMVSAVGDQKAAFETMLPRAPSQQKLLKLIAVADALEAPTSKDVLRALGVTQQAASKAAEALLAGDLVERDRQGRLRIVRGLFQQWLLGTYEAA